MATRRNGRRRGSGRDSGEHAEAKGRAIWSGTISFGLVAVPVNLFAAVRGARTPMRMLAPDGVPVQRRYVCPQHERDVPWDELVRGYEVGEDEYVVLTDDELEAASPRKSRDIDLRLFVPAQALDPFLFERAYVLTPGGDSNKPYRLLADVMEREQKAGIATFVMRTKEYLVAILARGGILWAETLRFAGELRSPKTVGLPAPGKPDRNEVAAFVRAIRAAGADELPLDELRDPRESRLQQVLAEKQKRGDQVVEVRRDEAAAPAADEPPDMLDVIRRSLRLVEGGKKGTKAREAKTHAAKAPAHDRLRALSKHELYERAQALDVPGRSAMSKSQLLAAVEAAAG